MVHTEWAGKDRGPFRLTLDTDNNIIILDNSEEQIWSAGALGEGSEYTRISLQDDGTIWVVDDEGCIHLPSVGCTIPWNYSPQKSQELAANAV